MACDPVDFFDGSYTKMQTVPSEDVAEMQLKALRFRFSALRDRIPVLTRLADGQGIQEIETIDEIVPLLFEHTAFKSYPTSLIDRKRFDQLTRWLGKLTSHDLSGVDVSNCLGLDDWFAALEEQTPLMPCHSSGTTGTFSILPWSKAEWDTMGQISGVLYLQEFGEKVDFREWRGIEVVYPYFSGGSMAHMRNQDMVAKWIAQGKERYHAAIPERISSDVMYLAGRILNAKARGQIDSLEIDPGLLAKKEKYDRLNAEMPQHLRAFFANISKILAGERVFITATWNLLDEISKAGLERGMRGVFASDSMIVSGGGAKGMTPPADWKERTLEFTGAKRICGAYGMSEIIVNAMKCDHDRYHLNPWCIPFVLDPDSSRPLPRAGIQTGRAAFFDLTAESRWGGFITGDEVTIHWGADCACGRQTPYLEEQIQRYSEKRGGDDKITCAATEDAHNEAMEYLRELDQPATFI
jgi:hypothetical protein